jgi:glycosyltransferase involved in cell wall biosynthesis
MFSIEKRLVWRCSLIFTSSENLRFKLAERYQLSRNTYVINNAIQIPNSDVSSRLPQGIEEKIDRIDQKKLMYVGTISEWIDTELILESLHRHPKGIVYLFVGPAEVALPDDDRIISFPPVEHQYLPALMKKADALIMPFKLNELIKSVNPIKIYEYIYSCKPTISIGYDETENFKDYIYTYRNHNEYHLLLEKLVQNKLIQKKSPEECEAFAKNHTWHKRTEAIKRIIQGEFERN